MFKRKRLKEEERLKSSLFSEPTDRFLCTKFFFLIVYFSIIVLDKNIFNVNSSMLSIQVNRESDYLM